MELLVDKKIEEQIDKERKWNNDQLKNKEEGFMKFISGGEH